jgi:hypothetical protein
MTQQVYRGNLNAKSFPFISDNFGRTVIVGGQDQNFNRQLYSSADGDRDIGIPQFYYAHNVMPSTEGLQSVGYIDLTTATKADINQIFLLQDSVGNKAYLAISSIGEFYVLDYYGALILKGTFVGTVTHAFISGVTYVYVDGVGCMYYDFSTAAFVTVVLTGTLIVGTDRVRGICAAAGYMVVWTYNAVAWSSLIDPTDFTPSLATGAGGGNVEGAKGNITFCVTNLLGFIAYTNANAVAAIYSGNSRYPFNFREIVGSGGIDSLNLIALDSNTGNHYVYSTSGLQIVSSSQAQLVYPEITDFISGQLFEDFNSATNQYIYHVLGSTLKKRLNIISDRYMVLSYGIERFTHALVYDMTMKRYGKLKITHANTFEYQLPNIALTETPRQSIGFILDNGSIKILSFNVNAPADAVLILGKYQYVRSRLLVLDEIELENIPNSSTFSILLESAVDGKNFTNSTPSLIYSDGKLRRYGSDKVAKNHSIICKGQFNLNTIELKFHIHGKA